MTSLEILQRPDAAPALPTARELLAVGECSAACLLAFAPNFCQCRCGGTYHGALLDADVPERDASLVGQDDDAEGDQRMLTEDQLAEIEKLVIDQKLSGAELRLRIGQVLWDCDARTAAGRLGMARATYYRHRMPRADDDAP